MASRIHSAYRLDTDVHYDELLREVMGPSYNDDPDYECRISDLLQRTRCIISKFGGVVGPEVESMLGQQPPQRQMPETQGRPMSLGHDTSSSGNHDDALSESGNPQQTGPVLDGRKFDIILDNQNGLYRAFDDLSTQVDRDANCAARDRAQLNKQVEKLIQQGERFHQQKQNHDQQIAQMMNQHLRQQREEIELYKQQIAIQLQPQQQKQSIPHPPHQQRQHSMSKAPPFPRQNPQPSQPKPPPQQLLPLEPPRVTLRETTHVQQSQLHPPQQRPMQPMSKPPPSSPRQNQQPSQPKLPPQQLPLEPPRVTLHESTHTQQPHTDPQSPLRPAPPSRSPPEFNE